MSRVFNKYIRYIRSAALLLLSFILNVRFFGIQSPNLLKNWFRTMVVDSCTIRDLSDSEL